MSAPQGVEQLAGQQTVPEFRALVVNGALAAVQGRTAATLLDTIASFRKAHL